LAGPLPDCALFEIIRLSVAFVYVSCGEDRSHEPKLGYT
jgi:hypothetical protein